jgi:hypothetical protein
MTDLDQRADRVKTIVETMYGSIISRDGEIVWCEIPADLIGGFASLCTMAGFFPPCLKGQTTKPAHQRVTNMQGHITVCADQPMITMAHYRYAVDLRPHRVVVDHTGLGNVAAITRQTGPVKP